MNSNERKFEELFEEHFSFSVNELMENYEYAWNDKPKNALNLELVSDKTEDISDSYDFTDELLEKVFYHKELDVYIKFSGRNTSYVGEEWNSAYQFVTPKIQEIKIYE